MSKLIRLDQEEARDLKIGGASGQMPLAMAQST